MEKAGKKEADKNTKTGEECFESANIGFEERADLLDKTQWAQDFDWQQIEATVKYMRVKHVPEGAVLFREGTVESFMCLILEGTVRIEKEDEQGSSKPIAMLGPGQMIGELSLFDDEPRSASAVALKDTTFLLFRRKDFERMSTEMPLLALKVLTRMLRLMAERLRRTSGVLADYL